MGLTIAANAPFHVVGQKKDNAGTLTDRWSSPTPVPVYKVGLDRDGYGVYVKRPGDHKLYWVQPCFLKEDKS